MNPPHSIHPSILPTIAIAGISLIMAPSARAGTGSANSTAFTLETRNLAASATHTVHTDKRAYRTADNVPGSLRQAIANAGAGETVDFVAGLSGQTITLGGTQLSVGKNLAIDGSGLAGGVTIDAERNSRVFEITNASDVTITGITLTGGDQGGARGGGIHITSPGGAVTVRGCTFRANHSAEGAAIYSFANPLVLENCTFTENTGTFGTLQNRTAAIISHTTIANNSGGGQSGGIWINGPLTLKNSIIANNTGNASFADVRNVNQPITYEGANLIQKIDDPAGGSPIDADPMLGPLADNGGPTQTMAPLAGSPAIDGGGVLVMGPIIDQRGVPRVVNGNPDIGAVEILPAFVPGSGAVRPAVGSQQLTWSNLGVPTYRLYLGTDESAVGNAMPGDGEDQGTTATTSFDPGGLPSGGTYFWRVDAINPGDVVVKGAVQSFGTITPQPDTRIGTKGNPATHKRDDVYTPSGAGQVARVKLKGRRKGKIHVSLQNDGDNVDALKLSRIKARKTLKLKSFQLAGGRRNITAALKRGSYTTPELDPGELVRILTQAKAKGKKKARQTLKYRAASQVVPGVLDAAKGKVKAVRK